LEDYDELERRGSEAMEMVERRRRICSCSERRVMNNERKVRLVLYMAIR